MIIIKCICDRCGEEFESSRIRKCCFNCTPRRHKYSTEQERRDAKRKSNIESVKRRRSKLKDLAIEYKGGKCVICGYDKCKESLQFHHVDPSKKEFGISEGGRCRSWERIKYELDKCLLVCSNCHGEIHANLIDINKYY